ncbi:methyltransferase domain-containing protein [Patescibacteria group bacterium]|nr:methyltransferase domain-containing protein [Patescibacteria group bacterium]
MDVVENHFDNLAAEYDFWKKKNWYYYDAVKKVYAGLIPSGSRVLEIGCGTGDILASLNPPLGIGIDASGGMIRRAQKKYAHAKNLLFQHIDIANFSSNETFDYIFLADVIEHLPDVSAAIRSVARLMRSDTNLIISMANPLWEPALMLAEKLHLKMPEGPHTRISARELIAINKSYGLILKKRKYVLPFPVHIPFFSNFFNFTIERMPFINKTGVIMVFVFVKS